MRLTGVMVFVVLGSTLGCTSHRNAPLTAPPTPRELSPSNRPWTLVEGAPVRGDTSHKQIALVFTGGEFGEGTPHILDALATRRMPANFFVTGDFLRKPELRPLVSRMIADGHYVGPHSDAHPLYCPWEDRSKTLVTESFFKADLRKNIHDLRALGALHDAGRPVYFIPPYEWYNAEHTRWAREMGVVLFNFTPGSGSNRDFAPEGHKSFVASAKLVDDVLAYERKDPHGLNGFLLLLHLGSQRQDKVHPHLGGLLDDLAARGYGFVRVDAMLKVN
jgi:peptidoglycan/xylan/chitin deacetylase (PgdA/CDA1 family)